MNRFDFYLAQLVSESEIDGAFDAAEQADWDMMADFGLVGVAQGLVATQHAPTPDLTIDITAGTAYDSNGQRIEIGSAQTLNLAVDSDSNSTAVGVGGNSKVLSVFLFAQRTLSDPRVDGNSNTVQFSRAESFEFKVVQGSEATTGAETPPSLEVDKVLLCDVTIDFGQTQIFDADINANAVGGNRRQDAFVVSAGSLEVRSGTPEGAVGGVLTELNNHITDVANAHGDTAIDAGAKSGTATSLTAGTVSSQIQEIIDELPGFATTNNWTGASNTFQNFVTIGGGTDPLRLSNINADIVFSNDNANGSQHEIRVSDPASGTAGRSIALIAGRAFGNTDDGGNIILQVGQESAASTTRQGGKLVEVYDGRVFQDLERVVRYWLPTEEQNTNGGSMSQNVFTTTSLGLPENCMVEINAKVFHFMNDDGAGSPGDTGWEYTELSHTVGRKAGGNLFNLGAVTTLVAPKNAGSFTGNEPALSTFIAVGTSVDITWTTADQNLNSENNYTTAVHITCRIVEFDLLAADVVN